MTQEEISNYESLSMEEFELFDRGAGYNDPDILEIQRQMEDFEKRCDHRKPDGTIATGGRHRLTECRFCGRSLE
jgi:hypothetical protein